MGAGIARAPGEGYGQGLPGSLDGLKTYFGSRGFQESPSLESDVGQVASFAKPLPVGRVHVRVFRGTKYYTIDTHRDAQDPNRNPLGHVQDILFSPKHSRRRVRRTDSSQN
jgi:hypothetical protein